MFMTNNKSIINVLCRGVPPKGERCIVVNTVQLSEYLLIQPCQVTIHRIPCKSLYAVFGTNNQAKKML